MKKLISILLVFYVSGSFSQQLKTENVILITFDGLRWQEVFNGGDSVLMNQQPFLKDKKIKEKFWRDNLTERRKTLLPFFWNRVSEIDRCLENRALDSK